MKQLFKRLCACMVACLVFASLGATAFAQAAENSILKQYNVTIVNADEVFLFPEGDVAILAEWYAEDQHPRNAENFYKQLLKKRQAYYAITAEEIVLATISYLGVDSFMPAYANSAIYASYKNGSITMGTVGFGEDGNDNGYDENFNHETIASPRKIVTKTAYTAYRDK